MKDLIKNMTRTMAILMAIEILITLLVGKGTLGVLIGSSGAFVNLYSLWYDINRMVVEGRTTHLRVGYTGRYVLSAAILFVSGLISVGDLLGAFVGLMNLKFSAYLSSWGESV